MVLPARHVFLTIFIRGKTKESEGEQSRKTEFAFGWKWRTRRRREEGRRTRCFFRSERARERELRKRDAFFITASLREIEKTTREGGSNAVKERRRRDEGDVKTL